MSNPSFPPYPTQQIVLAVDGVPNASQNRADFTAGAGILIAPVVGGGILFQSTAGITPGSLFPFSGIPSGEIPGSEFVVPFTLLIATVFVNGLALMPGTSYVQDGQTFTLTTPLETGDVILIQGWYTT